MKQLVLFFISLIFTTSLMAASPTLITYKTIKRNGKTYELKLHIFNPENHKNTDLTPCIVTFHPGGWSGGAPKSCYSLCRRLSSEGMVAISAEYSIRKTHEGTPFDSVRDAKSAIRWVRSNAKTLGIDPDMIAAGGASAGGHVAAAAAHLKAFDDEGDDLKVSCKPNALVLRSPVINNGPDGYGYKKVKERWKEFSPAHNVEKGAPPTIIFVGDQEARCITVEAAKKYQKDMKSKGSRCELTIYAGEKHGCFGKLKEIREKEVTFLKSLGYIK